MSVATLHPRSFAGSVKPPAAPAASTERRKRFSTSGWSLADQCAVSLGNFGTNILLARYLLDGQQYGTFGLIVGIMLFLNSIQGSLINYPLSVRGAAADEVGLHRFILASLLLTLLLAPALSFAVAGATYALHAASLAPYAIAALVCWQLQETLRRGLMAHLRYREAILGDAVSYLGQAVIILVLAALGMLNLPRAFLAMAVTSLGAAVLQASQLKLRFRRDIGLLKRASEYWQLGRWMVFGNLIGLVNIQAVPWVLATYHGVAEAGKLLALGNLLGVTHPAIFSIGNLIVPATSKARATGGLSAATRTAVWYGCVGGLLVVPYYLGLMFFPSAAIRAFYGSASPYLELTLALRFFALCYILGYLSAMLMALLNGLQKSRAAFWAQVASVSATLLVTLPLARLGGVVWGLAGGCVSTSMGVLVGGGLLRAHGRNAKATEGQAALSPSVS